MWIKMSGALLAAMSMVSLADAGLFSSKMGCGDVKSCGCASTCQPACCKPVIVKPCCPNVYTYQRKCSDIKPPCCDTCCPPATCCAPAAPACAAPAACAPACAAPAACAPACAAPAATCAPAAAPACAAPAACAPAPMACAPACAAPAATCAPAAAPACAAPCAPAAPACAAPCAPACAAPTACTPACNTCAPVCGKKHGGLLSGLFAKHSSKKMDCGSCNTCAAPTPTCAAPCEVKCCNADPCEVAKLIYESQTACYAKDRRKAIHKLGDKFDCICNPEIMTAFIVGLNDCDERVRWKAADEIGDQIRKNCCCCPEVVAALTCALGDCDKHVVKQAKEALELCGYEVVDGCCDTCAPATCTNGCAPAAPATPAPVPPCTTGARSTGMGQLLGLLD